MLDFVRESILGFPPFITYFGVSVLMLIVFGANSAAHDSVDS